jgi:predicted nucleic acid-binding protein
VSYLDTSCLIKFLRNEEGSEDVRQAINAESEVIVSSLAELETEIQLKAAFLSGELRSNQFRQFQARLVAMRNFDPFHYRHLPASVFSAALRQHRHPHAAFCRALDRLHLAAMEELNQSRLITFDETQARVARSLGFAVTFPGRESI